jgi:hypothetical protein
MQHEIEITTRKLELEKRRLSKLDEEVTRARAEHDDATLPESHSSRKGATDEEDDKKKKKKGVAAGKTSAALQGPIKALQNRLDTQTKKLDQVMSDSKVLRDQVDQIRKERLQMNHVFKKLHEEIRETGSLIAGLTMEIDANKDDQCDAGQRINVMKKKLDQERTSFKSEVLRLREEMKKQDREKKAFEVKLNSDNIGRHCRKDYIIADEEEDFSEDNVMRRILKLAFLNCIQRRHIKQHQKNIEVFEQAFATIKSTTGISDIEEIVKIFVKLEERNFSLLTYVNQLNREIESLEKQLKDLQNQEEEHTALEAKMKSRRKQALQETDKHLQQTKQTIEESEKGYDKHREILDRAYAVLKGNSKKLMVLRFFKEDGAKTEVSITNPTENPREDNRWEAVSVQESDGTAKTVTKGMVEKIIPSVKSLIFQIAARVEKESGGRGGTPPPDEKRDEHIPEWLTYIEKQLSQWREFLPLSKHDKHFRPFPCTVGTSVKQLTVKKHQGPGQLLKTSDLPAANFALEEKRPVGVLRPVSGDADDESDEEDFGDRPFTPAELKEKSLVALAKRKKHKRLLEGTGATVSDSGKDQVSTPAGKSDQHHDDMDKDLDKTLKPTKEDGEGSSDEDDDEENAAEPTDEELNEIFLKRYKMSKEELQSMADKMGIQLNNLCYLKQEFDAYDEDRSGYIDVKELRELLNKLGEELSEEELEQAFKELDADGSGEIEFFEFVEWFTSED